MARMYVEQLRTLIADMPDRTNILIPTTDHGYRLAEVKKTTALYKEGEWTEDHGEALTSEADYGKRVEVLVIE